MKKILGLLCFILLTAIIFPACDDSKTYAEMMEEERELIKKFMADSGFYSVDNIPADTVCAPKEFVLFSDGLYMNIQDIGSGEYFKSGMEVTVRFTEYRLHDGIIMSNNKPTSQGTNPDVFRYQLSGSTQSGIFISEDDSESSLMYSIYGSTAVPSGWLVPLKYIRDGGKVRLIVPHKLGQSDALYYVYPCYYEIQYGISKR